MSVLLYSSSKVCQKQGGALNSLIEKTFCIMNSSKFNPILVILAVLSNILALIQYWNGKSTCFSLVLLIFSLVGQMWLYRSNQWMPQQPGQQAMTQFVVQEHFGKLRLPNIVGNEAEIRVRRVYSSEEIDVKMHHLDTSLALEAGKSTEGITESSSQEYSSDQENGNASPLALENRNADDSADGTPADTPKDEKQSGNKRLATSQPKSEVLQEDQEHPGSMDESENQKKLTAEWELAGGSTVEVPVTRVARWQDREPGHSQGYHQNESKYQSGYKETTLSQEAECHCDKAECHSRCHCHCCCHCHCSGVQMTKEAKMEWAQKREELEMDVPLESDLHGDGEQSGDGCGHITCYSTCLWKCFCNWGTNSDTWIMAIVGALLVNILLY